MVVEHGGVTDDPGGCHSAQRQQEFYFKRPFFEGPQKIKEPEEKEDIDQRSHKQIDQIDGKMNTKMKNMLWLQEQKQFV